MEKMDRNLALGPIEPFDEFTVRADARVRGRGFQFVGFDDDLGDAADPIPGRG